MTGNAAESVLRAALGGPEERVLRTGLLRMAIEICGTEEPRTQDFVRRVQTGSPAES